MPALAGVDFTLSSGERTLLLGPSGGGKSTLLLALAGLIPGAVHAHVEGAVTRSGVAGIVFQDPDTQICMPTVEEDVAFGLENDGVPSEEMAARIDAALRAVDLARQRAARADRLSGGQRQRLALAGVLARSPRALLLDEPTAHLDPAATRAFLDHLRALDVPMVIVEHKLEGLIPWIDRVVVLGDGVVLADGPPGHVFRRLADELERRGVWLPPATRLARAAGLPVELTLDDLAAAVRNGRDAADAVLSALPAPRPPLPAGAGADHEWAVAVSNLSHTYPGGAAPALDRVSLRVPAGDFLAIVGGNGSGKTTLALHLAGVLDPPRGKVLVFGRDVSKLPAMAVARQIGYVFQNPEHQFVTDTALDEVAYTLRARGVAREEARACARATLDEVGLLPVAAAHPYRLSQGQKRRLSVATVLVAPPRILVLDEPTFGQDARTNERLLDALIGLNDAGFTIVMITHDIDAVWRCARSIAILAGGRIAHAGPVTDLADRPAILEDAALVAPFAVRARRAVAAAAGRR